MAFQLLMGGPTEDNTLIDQYIIPDLCCFPDDHAHAMVDEESPADLGSGVNLDPCQEAAEVGEQTAEEAEPMPP
jgi:hypothetical protein